MAEYSTDTPLWDRSPDASVGALLHPPELGVSPELSARPVAWNDRFGRLALNDDLRWGSPAEAKAWEREGLDLAYELQHELGRDVEVLYSHDAGG